MFLFTIYAPPEMCESKKEVFYTKFDSVLDQSPLRDALIVLNDIIALTVTNQIFYDLWVGPHGSGTKDTNNPLLLNFA